MISGKNIAAVSQMYFEHHKCKQCNLVALYSIHAKRLNNTTTTILDGQGQPVLLEERIHAISKIDGQISVKFDEAIHGRRKMNPYSFGSGSYIVLVLVQR